MSNVYFEGKEFQLPPSLNIKSAAEYLAAKLPPIAETKRFLFQDRISEITNCKSAPNVLSNAQAEIRHAIESGKLQAHGYYTEFLKKPDCQLSAEEWQAWEEINRETTLSQVEIPIPNTDYIYCCMDFDVGGCINCFPRTGNLHDGYTSLRVSVNSMLEYFGDFWRETTKEKKESPPEEDALRWWVSGASGKNSLTHALLICGEEQLESEDLCSAINALNERQGTKLVSEEVKGVFLALENEVKQTLDGKDKYEYHVYENDKVPGGVTYFHPEVLELVCKAAHIKLPDEYWKYRAEWKEHNQRVFDDPIYRMNVDIQAGKDVSPALLSKDMPWDLSCARHIIYGRGNQEDRGYDWYLEKKKYWEGGIELLGNSVRDYIDVFYRMAIKGGYAEEYKVYNLAASSDPSEWQIDPQSFIEWCAEKGIYLRDQIKSEFSVGEDVEGSTPKPFQGMRYREEDAKSHPKESYQVFDNLLVSSMYFGEKLGYSNTTDAVRLKPKDSLIPYAAARHELTRRDPSIKEVEIKLAVHDGELLTPLSRNHPEDYSDYFCVESKENFHSIFFSKQQLEIFTPKRRLYDYSEVKAKFSSICAEDEDLKSFLIAQFENHNISPVNSSGITIIDWLWLDENFQDPAGFYYFQSDIDRLHDEYFAKTEEKAPPQAAKPTVKRGRKGLGVREIVDEHNRRFKAGEREDDYHRDLDVLMNWGESRGFNPKRSTIEKQITLSAWKAAREIEYRSN